MKEFPYYSRDLRKDDLYLDIETQGLSMGKFPIARIDVACLFDEDTLEFVRIGSEDEQEEAAIIAAFLEKISGSRRLITYNGERFDLPYLEIRAALHGLSFRAEARESLDLYRIVKERKELFPLLSYSQESLEEYFGIHRRETDAFLTGMVPLHTLLHYRLLGSCQKQITQLSYDEEDERLIVFLKTDLFLPHDFRLRRSFFYIIGKPFELRCTLRLINGGLRCYLPNAKDYVYLPDEGIVIPKKLARSIPKDRKRPARPEECFTEIKIDPHNPDENRITDYVGRILNQTIG